MLKNDDTSTMVKIKKFKALTPLERNRRKIKVWISSIRKLAKELGYNVKSTGEQLQVNLDYTHAKSFKFSPQNKLGYLSMRDRFYEKLSNEKIVEGWNQYCFLSIRDEESLLDAMNVLRACINSRAGR
jgi:hypothetical protein